MSQNNYLTAKIISCSTCENPLPLNGDYVKCYNCGFKYHYNPCCTLSESSYSVMNIEKKTSWKCQKCREKARSQKTSVSEDDHQHIKKQSVNKQQRENDDTADPNPDDSRSKRFKDALSLTSVNSNVTQLISNVTSFKSSITSDINGLKNSIDLLNSSLSASNQQLREEMSEAYKTLAKTMCDLTSQVVELKKINLEQETRLQIIENKNNMLEQQLIKRSVEIKNVPNKNLSPDEVIKNLADSLNINLQDSDIDNCYEIKKNNKIVVEFCSLNKKREMMSKIHRHRVDGNIFNNKAPTKENKDATDGNNTQVDNNNTNVNSNGLIQKSIVYVNDYLTKHNRHLLWVAKNKAKEIGWKFVWFSNGCIYAKKTDQSLPLRINSMSDIEIMS